MFIHISKQSRALIEWHTTKATMPSLPVFRRDLELQARELQQDFPPMRSPNSATCKAQKYKNIAAITKINP